MKAKLIVNPVSGADTAPDFLTLMNERLRHRYGAVDISLTVGPDDAVAIAKSATLNGYDHIFAAGGDGTINEVVNGVAQVAGGLDTVIFGIIPLGTGNDFASALGIPPEVPDALEALLVAEPQAVDVGTVNGVHFINVSAGGFIAEVSQAVTPQLKTLAGRLAYLIGGAQVLLEYEPVVTELVSVADSAQRWSAPVYAFAVCNSRLVGGGRLIAPDALVDDGLLDVCVIEAMPTVEFLTLLRSVSNGEHVEDSRVSYFRTSSLELAFARETKINTDGEVLETTRVRYGVRPKAARFLADRSAGLAFTSLG